jgi:signal transduction histidine kinase/ligand-binding sensor domain-containing protein
MEESILRSVSSLLSLFLRLCAAALLACAAHGAVAATRATLRFESLNKSHGLPSENALAIAQDRQGFIWIGGQDGLSRYDGYEVRVYRHNADNPSSLADNWVRALYADPQGILWIGTQAGLQRYEPASGRFTLFLPGGDDKSTPNSRNVRSIVAGPQGSLWIGTDDGLQQFTPATAKFSNFRHDAAQPGSLVNNSVPALAMDKRGRLWIGTRAGLDRYDGAGAPFRHFRLPAQQTGDDAKRNIIRALLVVGDQLWIGNGAGVELWDIAGDEPVRRRYGEADGMPAEYATLGLAHDNHGDVWIATNGGLFRYSDKAAASAQSAQPAKSAQSAQMTQTPRITRFAHDPTDSYSVPAGQLTCLWQDRSGTLWIGSLAGGVGRADLDSGGFRRLRQSPQDPDGLTSNLINKVDGDRAGGLWLSTNHGLNHYDPASGKITVFRHEAGKPGSLGHDNVTGVAYDKSGRMWVGTTSGLNLYDAAAKRFTPRPFEAGDPGNNAINHMITDRAGMLWAGTLTGLRRLDPVTGEVKTWRHDAADPNSLASDFVNAVMEDRAGQIWVGTYSGLDRFDPATGRFRHFVNEGRLGGLNHNRIWTVMQDRKGTVWAGTPLGLNRVDIDAAGKAAIHSYPTDATLDAILEGDDGRLWVSTDAGVSAFDPETGRYTHYTSSDGLIEGGFINHSAYAAPDGTLNFGGFSGGLLSFRPKDVITNPRAPQVAITDISVFNKSVYQSPPADFALSGPLDRPTSASLSYRHSVLSIEFAALHFADPQRNSYAYQLEGFDTDWVATSPARRVATYTNLDPGTYRFRVKAANKNGVWNDSGVALTLTIVPPLWKTWWFRTLMVVLAALAAYAFYRSRIRSLLRQQQILEQQVRERTKLADDALASLKETQQQMVLQEKMASVGTLTAGIAHEINNPVNFAHVGAQNLGGELHKFHEFLLHLAGDDVDDSVVQAIDQHFARLDGQVSVIAEGTSRIRLLVKDLLNFARLGEAERNTVAVGDSLSSTVNLVRTRYARTIDIVCTLDANPVLECWPSLLNQVFMNLIVNACQAIESRREKEPSLKGRLSIRSHIDGTCLKLTFEDNGCGIAAEDLDRIFEPFYTTKEVGNGTGLGLSISFGIVQKHGGRLEAHSTVGAGSSFTVVLPMA